MGVASSCSCEAPNPRHRQAEAHEPCKPKAQGQACQSAKGEGKSKEWVQVIAHVRKLCIGGLHARTLPLARVELLCTSNHTHSAGECSGFVGGWHACSKPASLGTLRARARKTCSEYLRRPTVGFFGFARVFRGGVVW